MSVDTTLEWITFYRKQNVTFNDKVCLWVFSITD